MDFFQRATVMRKKRRYDDERIAPVDDDVTGRSRARATGKKG